MRAALLQTPSCCSYWAQAQKDPFIHGEKKIKHTPWLIGSHQNNHTIIVPSLSPLLRHTGGKSPLRCHVSNKLRAEERLRFLHAFHTHRQRFVSMHTSLWLADQLKIRDKSHD